MDKISITDTVWVVRKGVQVREIPGSFAETAKFKIGVMTWAQTLVCHPPYLENLLFWYIYLLLCQK